MLKNKLSHIAILEEQVEKLQDLANQFSAITGHSLEEVEEGIVRLLTPLALDNGDSPRLLALSLAKGFFWSSGFISSHPLPVKRTVGQTPAESRYHVQN